MSRIIAGSAKGRRLTMPAGPATRPTSDVVREALFARLVSWSGGADHAPDATLRGLAVLDLFAGSGAVALEAASRGAAPVVAVESDPRAVRVIRQNVEATGLDVQTRTQDALAFLRGGAGELRFDIVWADPPYDLPDRDVDELVRLARTVLAPDGLVVVERADRSPAPAWAEEVDAWQARYGGTTLHFGQ